VVIPSLLAAIRLRATSHCPKMGSKVEAMIEWSVFLPSVSVMARAFDSGDAGRPQDRVAAQLYMCLFVHH
jgi:hypothetical protein